MFSGLPCFATMWHYPPLCIPVFFCFVLASSKAKVFWRFATPSPAGCSHVGHPNAQTLETFAQGDNPNRQGSRWSQTIPRLQGRCGVYVRDAANPSPTSMTWMPTSTAYADPVSIVSGLQFELRFVESFTVICAPIKNCSGGNMWIYLNWSVVAASSIYRLPFNFHVTFSSAWKQKWKYYKAACIQIRDTKSSRGFVIESPAQMTRLHNILGVITFHIFSILFLRCWHQTVQHFFNWKLNKDGFGLFRDSLGRSRLQVAVPKGLHKGGAIQRHGSVSLGAKLVENNSTENSSGLPDVFLLFQATKEYPKSSMTSMGTFGYIWAIVRFPMVFRGFPVVLYNSVRGNSTYDSREPFFAMEAAIRSTMTRAGEQDDSGKAAWTQNFTPYQLGMQTLTSLVSICFPPGTSGSRAKETPAHHSNFVLQMCFSATDLKLCGHI